MDLPMITLSKEVSRQSPEKMNTQQSSTIKKSIFKIKEWMDTVRLKINESKTKFMLLGRRQHLKKCTTNSLEVLGENIKKSEVI